MIAAKWMQTGERLWANGYSYVSHGMGFTGTYNATSETFATLGEAQAWCDEQQRMSDEGSGDARDDVIQTQPGVYAIEIEITSASTTVRTRYEAPTADEVVALAERSGERFEKPYIAGPRS